MALKIYEWNNSTYQFDDGAVPAGAVEVKAVAPGNKAVTPENKAVSDGKPATRAKR